MGIPQHRPHPAILFSSLLITGPLLTTQLQAQGQTDRCAELRKEYQTLKHTARSKQEPLELPMIDAVDGIARARALFYVWQSGSRNPAWAETKELREFQDAGMRAFAVKYGLGDALTSSAKITDPARFYYGMTTRLWQVEERLTNRYDALMAELMPIYQREESRLRDAIADCERGAAPRLLDFPRYADGRVVISSSMITRWINGLDAKLVGIPPWKSARMTEMDFSALSNRIREYRNLRDAGAGPVTLERSFTSDEATALQSRYRDIQAALARER